MFYIGFRHLIVFRINLAKFGGCEFQLKHPSVWEGKKQALPECV